MGFGQLHSWARVRAHGALSVAVPTSRLNSRENPEWAAMTRQTASEISSLFGFLPGDVETEQGIPI